MSTNRLPALTEPAPARSFLNMSQPDPDDRAPAVPDTVNTYGTPADEKDPAAELIAAAKEIRAWQLSRGLSDAALRAEFPGLGSDKPYKKLWNGSTEEIDVAKSLRNYRAVLTEIELLEEAEAVEPVYTDIGQVGAIMSSLGRFIVQRGLRRFFLIEGASGSGKTNILNILCQRQPAKVLRLNGEQRWRSLYAFLLDLLDVLPAIDRTDDATKRKGRRAPNLHELMKTAATRLLASSRVLAIDEAQYLTGAALNFLKDCINKGVDNGVRFYVIAAGQDTLWKKLESSAEEEAKQLRHNRLFRRVRLAAPTAQECRDFLERTITFEGGMEKALDKAFAEMATAAASLGHLAFVRDVRDDIKAMLGTAKTRRPATVGELVEITKATRLALSGD